MRLVIALLLVAVLFLLDAAYGTQSAVVLIATRLALVVVILWIVVQTEDTQREDSSECD